MLTDGILNPGISELLCRFRHTNTIVIADKGFPFWPQVPTVDVSVVAGLPTVRQILAAMKGRYTVGAAFMATEFNKANVKQVGIEYQQLLGGLKIKFEPHINFKKRIPSCIGLIRTGDATQYGNIILESA